MKIFFKRKHGRRKAEIRWTAEQLQAMNNKVIQAMFLNFFEFHSFE